MPPKDKNAKDKPQGWDLDPIESAVVLLFFLAILGSLGPAIWSYISSGEISFYGVPFSSIIEFFKSKVWILKTFGYVVTSLAVFGTIFFNKKGDLVWREARARLYPNNVPNGQTATYQEATDPILERWKRVLEHVASENPSDWRIAIIEADIILDDLLNILKLPGSTMGDKLKAVEPSDFLTLDNAWEAHKARNMIAHQGSDFLLNQREVRRIISLYEAVFKEFKMI